MTSVYSALCALSTLALLATADGARQLAATAGTAAAPGAAVPAASQAVAPAPCAAAPAAVPVADSQSVLEADAAAFINTTTLFLAGVFKSVPLSIQSAAGRRTSRFALVDFVSSHFADASGRWMGHPQAVMHAKVKGSTALPQTWVLELSRPRYNPGAATLNFTAQVLGPGAAARYPGGAVSYALANADGSLTSQPLVGAVLEDVVIFIDDATAGEASASASSRGALAYAGGGALSGYGGADTAQAGGVKLSSVPLTGAYQPSNFGGLSQGMTPLPQNPPVSTSASTLDGGGSLLPPLNSTAPTAGAGGLVTGGTATVNSVSVYGRSSYCPNLGWIYAADPFRCTPFTG